MKRKNATEQIPLPSGQLISLLSLILPGFWIYIVLDNYQFLHPEMQIFYPIALITHTSDSISPALILLIGFFIGLLVFSKFSGAGWLITVSIFLIGAASFAFSVLLMQLSDGLIHQHTIELNNKRYHLAEVRGEIRGDSSIDTAYSIFQCDERGFFCQYYSTPYIAEGRIIPEGYLRVDDDGLYLQIDDKRIDVSRDISWWGTYQ